MEILNDSSKTIAVLVAGTAVKYAVLSWISRNKEEFVPVGKVSRLFVYPLKSCSPLTPQSIECTEKGCRYQSVRDREWLVVTNDGIHLTLRDEPLMHLVKPSIVGDQLQLDACNMPPISVPIAAGLDLEKTTVRKMKFRESEAYVVDCGDKVAAWLSKVIKREGLRLCYAHPSLKQNQRSAHNCKKNWATETKDTDTLVLQDFAQCMLLGKASVDAINEKLEEEVVPETFRPNVLVEGSEPFEEDNWKAVRIGNAMYRTLDHCTRCKLVTSNPLNGERYKNEEPLKTLRTFRCWAPYSPKPAVGIDLGIDAGGTINVGDTVYAVRRN